MSPVYHLGDTPRQTNTFTPTGNLCVSISLNLHVFGQEGRRKPTLTQGEHETVWLGGDNAYHWVTVPWWHLTWAAVVKSKRISPAVPWTSTLPLSTAPFRCQTSVWSYLSPARNPFCGGRTHFSLLFHTAWIYIFKHHGYFTKFHATRMKASPR